MTAPVVNAEHMRSVLAHFCSGITVITAIASDGRPVGFTCQSFNSLSLEPPLVSLCPARTSTTWPVIREADSFVVNVLGAGHDELSHRFARSGTDKFAGIRWTPAELGAPVLDGVTAWAECTLWAEYDGGDHTIVAARVLRLHADADSDALLFYRGAYHLAVPHPNHVPVRTNHE